MTKKIVGITACPAGIAHTYMAATALEKIATQHGYEVRIEKQGSMGTEDELSELEIAEADIVIIAVNKTVNLDRFKGKLLYQTSADHAMKNKDDLWKKAFEEARLHGMKGESVGDGTITLGKTNNEIMNHIMSGLSYMIPMIVAAGLLMAISNMFAFVKDDNGAMRWFLDENTTKGYFLLHLNKIGSVGFLLMIPVFAGMVANSIAGQPAIAAAMIGAYIANDAKYLGTETGGGFVSAIVVALAAGYLVRYLKLIKWPSFFKPILGIMILPLISTFVIMVVVTYGIGKPISTLMTTLYNGLNYLLITYPNSKFMIGAILGGMIGFDFGGPINKTAMLFGMGIMSDTLNKHGFDGANLVPDTANNAAICVAPLGIFIATKIFPKYFSNDEHTSAKAAFSMGIMGISEGAIPFACSRPLQTIVSSVIGSALAGGLSYSMDIEKMGGITGPLGAFTAYIQAPIHFVSWLFVCFAGVFTTAFLIGFWRKAEYKSTI